MVETGAATGRRRRARITAMRALYRAEVVGDPLTDVAAEIVGDPKLPEDVRDYAARLLDAVERLDERIDALLTAALVRWDLRRLAVIDRSVLRIGVAELLYVPDVPPQVVLDEAIEIAKRFGSKESGRFVNGVLDRVARDLNDTSSSGESST